MDTTGFSLSLRAETTLTEADRSYYKPEGQSFVQYLSTSKGREAEWQNKNKKILGLVQKLQVTVSPSSNHFPLPLTPLSYLVYPF